MQNNNNTREAKWWNTLSEKEKLNLFTEYAQNKFTFSNLPNQLAEWEIKLIYNAEHPELNKGEGGDNGLQQDWDLYPGNEAGAFDHLDHDPGTFPLDIPGMKDKGTEDNPDLLDGITPGEWIILWGNYTHFATINADTNTRICAIEVGDGHAKIEEAKKNALLIAAAPKLAAENKELRDHVLNFLGLIDTPVGRRKYKDHPLLWEAIQAAKKTIHHD